MNDIAAEIFDALRPLGTALSPAMVQGTYAAVTPHAATLDPALCESRWDIAYGDHPRHRLDLFAPRAGAPKAVIVFVHGGGFVGGDKGGENKPFFANIGAWATARGMAAVAMTYRHAPEAQWPDGGRDVAAALGFLAENAGEFFGGNPPVVPIGQSAGAAHVADCLAGNGGDHPPVAAAVLMSGVFDQRRVDPADHADVYYGDDPAQYPDHSTLDALTALDLPLLFTVAELDAPLFQHQAGYVVEAFLAKKDAWPRMHFLPGHNHVSPAPLIGSAADDVGPLVENFLRSSLPLTPGYRK